MKKTMLCVILSVIIIVGSSIPTRSLDGINSSDLSTNDYQYESYDIVEKIQLLVRSIGVVTKIFV